MTAGVARTVPEGCHLLFHSMRMMQAANLREGNNVSACEKRVAVPQEKRVNPVRETKSIGLWRGQKNLSMVFSTVLKL